AIAPPALARATATATPRSCRSPVPGERFAPLAIVRARPRFHVRTCLSAQTPGGPPMRGTEVAPASWRLRRDNSSRVSVELRTTEKVEVDPRSLAKLWCSFVGDPTFVGAADST